MQNYKICKRGQGENLCDPGFDVSLYIQCQKQKKNPSLKWSKDLKRYLTTEDI